MTTVLVVDDEPHLRRALVVNLKANGFTVIEAATGERALQMAASERPDLVVLDLGLPGMDGLEVITGLRGWNSVPILVLTVRDDQRTKVRALDLGADDYITKPFSMDELLARVRASLRRAQPEPTAEPSLSIGSCTVALADRRAMRGADDVHLTPTEWALLDHLARRPHKLVTQRQLLDAIWGSTYQGDPNLLRVHLGHLRRKLEDDPSRPRHLITEPGLGYRFEPQT
jgi:two-component system, OmpR family, KDP operon response regulator KdpE